MITREEFLKRKIFLKQKLSEIKREFPGYEREINQWWNSQEFDEEYDSTQEIKNFLMNKLKQEAEKENTEYKYDGELLYKLCIWYKGALKVCEYCKIKESDLTKLETSQKVPYINARSKTRGRSLEIDRKVSKLPYSNIENLTLACYWCNNAKTDTFTFDEFKKIGESIGRVWHERLS